MHFIPQGEGGEQGDLPHACTCSPWVSTDYWKHCRVTPCQNPDAQRQDPSVEPDGWERLDAEAQRSDPEAVVWRGNTMLPPSEQGVMVFGTPVGHWDFVKGKLEATSTEHQSLLEKSTSVISNPLGCCCCSAPLHERTTYFGTVHSDASLSFAVRHDISLRRCVSALLGAEVPEDTWDIALPLSVGGIGLRGAVRSRPAAHWADSLEMIQQRHEPVCAQILHILTRGGGSFHLEVAVRGQDLQLMGFDAPEWVPLAHGLRPRSQDRDDDGPGMPSHGWQRDSSGKVTDDLMNRCGQDFRSHEERCCDLREAPCQECPSLVAVQFSGVPRPFASSPLASPPSFCALLPPPAQRVLQLWCWVAGDSH